jgi:cytochrome c oxidase subunit 4
MAHASSSASSSSAVRYVLVWGALLALTALSLALSFAHLGPTDVAVALVIAAVKTALVAVFFMHLAQERFSVAMLPALGVFLFLLLVALTVTDVATRSTFPRTPLPDVGEAPGRGD